MEPTRPYAATDFVFTVNSQTVDGFGDGDAITVTPPTEQIKGKEGAQGEIAVTIKRSRLFTVKAVIWQTSAANGRLKALFRQQRNAGGTLIGVPLTIQNKRTGDFLRGNAWIVGEPEWKVGMEVGTREWTIEGEVPEESSAGASV